MKFTAFKNIGWFNKPLNNEFEIYLSKDKNNALNMIKSGYQPTFLQERKLQSLLIKEAKININFLDKYSSNFSLISDKAFINYLTHHALHDNLLNSNKNIYDSFSSELLLLKKRENFSNTLRKCLIKELYSNTNFLISIKPKYGSESSIRRFEFNNKQNIQHKKFLELISNSIILLPVLSNNLSDFIEVKDTIFNIREKILKHIKQYSKRGALFEKYNNEAYKIPLFDKLCNFLDKYNTKELEKDLIYRTKLSLENSKDNNMGQNKELDVVFSIQKLLPELPDETVLLANDIINNYEHIKKESSNPIFINELNNIFKDTLLACEKYCLIHIKHRNDKTNTEGKNAIELLNESLEHINEKFTVYINNIEEYKVSLLSAHNRKVKMK